VARRPRLVTLSTDMGPVYSAQIKGVLHRLLPDGMVVELTHELPRHQVTEGAFLVRQMARQFPPGSVHLAVVDPGVGGRRAPIAVRCKDESCLVGPDNGILYPLAELLGIVRTVRLDQQRLIGKRSISATFAGRDLFAPAAARLALGALVEDLGDPRTLSPLRIPEPQRRSQGVDGMVLHVDHFGNLISNIPAEWLPRDAPALSLSVGSRRPVPLSRARMYEQLPRGDLGLLTSSFELVEIALREDSAAKRLGVGVGEALKLRWRTRVKSTPAR
jgi:S-adenosyl-L-methionine hydrolase (adenosine-forming)